MSMDANIKSDVTLSARSGGEKQMIIYVEEIREIDLKLGYKGTNMNKKPRIIATDLVLSIDQKSQPVFDTRYVHTLAFVSNKYSIRSFMETIKIPFNIILEAMLRKLDLPCPYYESCATGKASFTEVLLYPSVRYLQLSLPHSALSYLAHLGRSNKRSSERGN